jgi:hypothetical protein
MVALMGALRPVSAETNKRVVKWKDIVGLAVSIHDSENKPSSGACD